MSGRAQINWTAELDAMLLSESLQTVRDRTGISIAGIWTRRQKLMQAGATPIMHIRFRTRWTDELDQLVLTQNAPDVVAATGISERVVLRRRKKLIGDGKASGTVTCAGCGTEYKGRRAEKGGRNWCPECRVLRAANNARLNAKPRDAGNTGGNHI